MPVFESRPARITKSGYNVGEKFHAAVSKASGSNSQCKNAGLWSNELHPFMRRLPTERSTTIELVVPKDDAKLRLDRVLAKQLPEYSRSRLQQLIGAGFVRVNGTI